MIYARSVEEIAEIIAILLCFDSESVTPPMFFNECGGCVLENARRPNVKSIFLNSFGGVCSTVLHFCTSSLEILTSRIWYRAYGFSTFFFVRAYVFVREVLQLLVHWPSKGC